MNRVTATDCVFNEAVFEENEIKNCDLSGSDFSEAVFRENTILDVRAFLADFRNVNKIYIDNFTECIKGALLPLDFGDQK